ncbi:hypothetical protein BH20VER3_BH20VER3_00650 [soil metagenome]
MHCAHHAQVPIADLKPNPANPNTHPARQIEFYGAAIRAHGWRESVTVSNRSGLVVRGHGAILAARAIGAAVVPVEFQDYGSADEELSGLLADNRLAHLSTTDAGLLCAALQELESTAVTGCSATEIAELLPSIAPEPAARNAGCVHVHTRPDASQWFARFFVSSFCGGWPRSCFSP